MKMVAKVDTRASWSPSDWLNLQGAKFKYILKNKVYNIDPLKLVQELSYDIFGKDFARTTFLLSFFV